MPQNRRIVPDASVLLPAYFRESLLLAGHPLELTPAATRLVAAVETRAVTAFAPDLLIYEFARAARSKVASREGGPTLDPEEIGYQVDRFLWLLPTIVWVAAEALASDAWQLMTQANIAPPDSWYLACARQYDAELWISHEHHDRFAEHARACHPKVYLLTEDDFDHPRNR